MEEKTNLAFELCRARRGRATEAQATPFARTNADEIRSDGGIMERTDDRFGVNLKYFAKYLEAKEMEREASEETAPPCKEEDEVWEVNG